MLLSLARMSTKRSTNTSDVMSLTSRKPIFLLDISSLIPGIISYSNLAFQLIRSWRDIDLWRKNLTPLWSPES
nr:hypothetical protein Iba_scaffold1462492CG0010 [Ipomoea batatas]